MVTLAQTEVGIPVEPEQLDCDPWLLNCLNGTVALGTGKLRPHKQKDLITKLASVRYDPEARSEMWERFLRRVNRRRRGVGGVPSEDGRLCADWAHVGEVLLLLIGPEASGKTTFIESVKAPLGDYAATPNSRPSFATIRVARGPT